ncbi:tumor necrosis factor ligand superfamily member 15 [Protobothrops mucrosquamatus]|uniref:tumor necrosis factor ligand superfamily member 15 n=1 Tax=Protobothrops mucrosquamatus TaxID=103944 RepID=UPI000775E0CB|nr:tumor necrosis factor ligand superfamily member 15 [Protobothrops mucrosquamatus]
MPLPEPRSAWRGSGGCRCARCGRGCQKREVQALRCLCALSFLGLLVLALPVLYLMRAKLAEEAAAEEEILMGKMSAPQKQYGSPPCNNSDSKIRPSIHARVDSGSKCINETQEGSTLVWDIDFQEGQFQLDDNSTSFIIPQDGKYFVYSQVTFSCFKCNCEEKICCGKKMKGTRKVWQTIIHKTSAYPKPSELFASISPINESKSLKSLYLAGIVPLKKDERLMVNVSNPGLVQPDVRYTFFGAYLIS